MDNNEAREILIEFNTWRNAKIMQDPKRVGQAIDCAIQALGDGWVSVDDILPDTLIDVMCWLSDTDEHKVLYVDNMGKFIDFDTAISDRSLYVTHWQPLPPKPKQP